MKNIRTFFILFALGIIAALGWWLSEQVAPTTETTHQATGTLPDYTMTDFTLTSMNTDGVPAYELRAHTMVHHPAQASSDLTQPYLLFFQPDAEPWHLQSETGNATDDGKLVNLLGEVHIRRKPSAGNRPMTLDTRNLSVHPERDFVETGEAVHMVSQGTDIRGTGMRARFDTEYIEILSRVRGVHEFKN